ncbi:UNVERIFIED_CONTAM: hypothetical protein K2H54_027866 [Gekko kuhli]
MLSLKQKMIGLNLYCGGAPAVAPASPGAGGQSPTASSSSLSGRGLWSPSEGARALIGGGPRAGAPRALIGPLEGAPRSLIGWAPPPPSPRPSKLPLPEDELDGCEPEAEAEAGEERGGPQLVPSPTASLASSEEEEEEDGEKKAEEEEDGLRAETREVVLRYLLEVAADDGAKAEGRAKALGALLGGRSGHAPPATPPAPSARVARTVETLRRVGDGVLEKHQLAFQGMLKKLEIKNQDDLKSVSEVATQVFSDGVTNWGRILTLISFGGFVAKHLKSINQESNIIPLAEIITDVLVKDKREWLVSHNGWEGFVRFFHVEDLESSIRNVLMAFASVAGIGAGLAYMIRFRMTVCRLQASRAQLLGEKSFKSACIGVGWVLGLRCAVKICSDQTMADAKKTRKAKHGDRGAIRLARLHKLSNNNRCLLIVFGFS